MSMNIEPNVFEKRVNGNIFISVKRINESFYVDLRKLDNGLFTKKGICLHVESFMMLKENAEQIASAIADSENITKELKCGVVAETSQFGVDVRRWYELDSKLIPTRKGLFIHKVIFDEIRKEFDAISQAVQPFIPCEEDPMHNPLNCRYCNPFHYKDFTHIGE